MTDSTLTDREIVDKVKRLSQNMKAANEGYGGQARMTIPLDVVDRITALAEKTVEANETATKAEQEAPVA